MNLKKVQNKRQHAKHAESTILRRGQHADNGGTQKFQSRDLKQAGHHDYTKKEVSPRVQMNVDLV
jgi:chorismate synthase